MSCGNNFDIPFQNSFAWDWSRTIWCNNTKLLNICRCSSRTLDESVKFGSPQKVVQYGKQIFYGVLSHRGFCINSTVTLFVASYFCHYLFILLLKPQKMPNKSYQFFPEKLSPWYKKSSLKKLHKRDLSREERNLNNNFLRGLVKRVLNDKA